MDATLPNELSALRDFVSTLQASLAQLQSENKLLRQKLDALARRIFGVSSEALDPAQLQPLLQMPELVAQPAEGALAASVVEPRQPAVRKPRARHACPTICPLSKK